MKIDGGYLPAAIRALTGVPVFGYTVSTTSNPAFDPVATFTLVAAADQANYIMTLGTTSGSDRSMNPCGIPYGHAYTLLSAFTLLDKTLTTSDAAYNQSMIMFRNPWGLDNTYNQTWNSTSAKWTADNLAQVPLGVSPKLSQVPDGVVVMPVSLIPTCFGNYYIGHLRDGQGFVRSWFDQESASAAATTFTWTPNTINDTVYVSVENYPLNLVPSACLSAGNAAALVNLEVSHNSKYYQMSWYD